MCFVVTLCIQFWQCKEERKYEDSLKWIIDYPLKPGKTNMVNLLDSIKTSKIKMDESYFEITWYKRFLHKLYTPTTTTIFQANQKLQRNQTSEAIKSLEAIESRISIEDLPLFRRFHETLAICYLRYGEEQNCILNHSNQSCLLPIQGNGIYNLKEPTQKAIEHYQLLLKHFPEDWRYRWLLNIAYQTIGEYPQNVPNAFLIRSPLLVDTHKHNNFKNIAPMLGVDFRSSAGGAILEDFNQDGKLDIITSGMVWDQLKFYTNEGKNGFVDRTIEAGLEGLIGGFNLVQLDYNNDGWMDFLVLRGAWRHSFGIFPNSLMKNNQDGTFSDVTVESGLLSFKPTSSAVCADFNQDGFTDIYVGNESGRADKFPNELFINSGDGTFKEVAEKTNTLSTVLTKGVTTGDYDNDGRIDLYVSNRHGKNTLLRNTKNSIDGLPIFSDVSVAAGVDNPWESFTTWFWDYNNDGWLDLFVSNYHYGKGSSAASAAKHYAGVPDTTGRVFLYQNNQDGTFTNLAKTMDLDFPLNTMAANFGDINNDGWLDFYLGTGEPDFMGIHPNRMLVNQAGKKFEDQTAELGLGHIQKGHGIAFGDIDHDGDQDILAEMGGTAKGDQFQNALFQNPGNDNNWVTLKLIGKQSSNDAIGTRVKIVLSNDSSKREIHRTVNSGGSFGANSLQLEVGLGNCLKIDSLIVDWVSTDTTQFFTDLEVNKHYILKETTDLSIAESPLIKFDLTDISHKH